MRVKEGTKLNGTKIDKDEVLIEYYITFVDILSDGDKLTNFSALKSIISKIIPEEDTPYGVRTGVKIDSFLSVKSPKARKTHAFIQTDEIEDK